METLFIGQSLIYLPQVDSTNSYAIELLKNVNPAEGTLIYTQNQTNGRGQRGNKWLMDEGLSLACSLILKPTFLNPNSIYHLYIISALAVHDLMSELINSSQFDIKIKWPNDILVNDLKIAGILNENIFQSNKLMASVIGIGINLNQQNFDEGIKATSLKKLTYCDYNFKDVLQKLCTHFEHYYLKLKNNKYQELEQHYLNAFYKRNTKHTFQLNDKTEEFTVIGINKTGLLHLKNNSNTDCFFDVKEIRWW